MDPGTAILMAALMILLNGGVLGLVQRELPKDLRPSAISWRIATLLHAAGCVLLALQTEASKIYVLPLANGLLLLGLAGYWRALRQFYGLGEHYGLLWPVALGVIVIYWFVAVHESFPLRVAAVSLAWFWLLLGCIRTLYSTGDRRGSASRDVLAGMFAVAAVFMMLRALYFLSASGSPSSLLDQRHWLNMVTPMVAAVIPVIGTTTFLLMCSQRLTRRWESAASTDYLTGLANRRTVVSKGDALIANAAASGADAALMVVDIDRFKQVNDRHGHAVGDRAIQHVARQLLQSCAGFGSAGRLGGEEFIGLLANVGPTQALQIAEQLRQAVEESPLQIEGAAEPLPLTVSIGVASRQSQDRDFTAWLQRADQALYAAKAAGRNRVASAG